VVYDNSVTGSKYFADQSLNLQVLYRAAPTGISLIDQYKQGVTIVPNAETGIKPYGVRALSTIFTDFSGAIIPSATAQDGTPSLPDQPALFINSRDASGFGLATTEVPVNGGQALAVGLRDNHNHDLSSLHLGNSDFLYVRPADGSGHAQAATRPVQGAMSGSGAFFLSAADNQGAIVNSSQTAGPGPVNDSEYIALTDSGGYVTGIQSNPLPVDASGVITLGIKPFNIPFGLTASFNTLPTLSNRQLAVYGFWIYNDGPTPIWTKLYDLPEASAAFLQLGAILGADASVVVDAYLPSISFDPAGSYQAVQVFQVTGGVGVYGAIDFSIIDHDPGVGPSVCYFNTGLQSGVGYFDSATVQVYAYGYNYNTGPTLAYGLYEAQVTVSADLPTPLGIPLALTTRTTYADAQNYLVMNIAVPPNQTRDLEFPQGLNIQHGLYFRATTGSAYDNSLSPGDNLVFVNGSYIDDAEAQQDMLVANLLMINQIGRSMNTIAPNTSVSYSYTTVDGFISGTINMVYNNLTQVLDITLTIVSNNLQPESAVVFWQDANGLTAEYNLSLTDYVPGSPITGSLVLAPSALNSLTVIMHFDNDSSVELPWST
jgi:hypothetical protein